MYMGMLVFLAANFFLALAFRSVGAGAVYGYLPPRLAFLGTALLLPGMALAAVLGARTYRTPRRRGTRVGMGIGALIGWSGFFSVVWLAIAFGLDRRDQIFQTIVFADLDGSFAFYAFIPLTLAATALVVFALYARSIDFERRQRLTLIGAALAVLAGLAILVADFDPLGVAGVLVSTVSGALGGYVSGSGYARAGGDDMIPPGAEIRRREPRRKPR
jgi:hypothetical protein